jgi:hypothetical protein
MNERETTSERNTDYGLHPLPYCEYPKAKDVKQHGSQALPKTFPLVNFAKAQPYRSRKYRAIVAASLNQAKQLQMARLAAKTFVHREPMCRHLVPPKNAPRGLGEERHIDPFGTDTFGPWTSENIFYWFVRLMVLTDPTNPKDVIHIKDETLEQSLAIVDNGEVLGVAFSEPMLPVDEEPVFRKDDLFMTAMLLWSGPILDFLAFQNAEAIPALSRQFPEFRDAFEHGKVGHHFMVGRSDKLLGLDTFELVAATMKHYHQLGYHYVGIEASNQWTGAACEVIGGIRVHFSPFQTRKSIRQSVEPLEGIATSPNGFISDKDSGCMFYMIRLE